LDYRNSPHVGYSYAQENPESVISIKHFKKKNVLPREELLHVLDHEQTEKNLFRSMLEKLPGHVYWLNRDNVYLGCNEQQAKYLGLSSPSKIIGKTNEAFHTKEGADRLDKINMSVIETGVAFEGEEFLSFTNTEPRHCLTHKTPLYDTHGKVVGLLGISIDITDRKRVEELETQNKIQTKFQKLAEQVSHDIRTPLQTLSMILKISAKNLPEKEYVALRDSVDSIRKIAQVFLEYSPEKEPSVDYQHILVSQALREVVDQKETQYADKNVRFQYSFDPSMRFTFIYGNALNFERMISNIINNSVEALEEKSGAVKIGFTTDDGNVKITVQDNGRGMPREVVEKLMEGGAISTTKAEGFGIGTTQIRDALGEFQGTQFVESTQNVGTKITLTIPKSASPKWTLEQINLRKNNVLVVLDDDILVHSMWKNRLEKYLPDISLHFFEKGQEAIDFINYYEKKDCILLLLDWELRNQPLNGLGVIQKSDIKNFQSILVSNAYNRKEIQDQAVELGIKILTKAFINDVDVIYK
jgi:PAS domain S-box-containing protein